MKTFNNYSQPDFSIHNKAERYSWAAYHLFVLLSSLIGDTLILFASLQKDAFKLNRFIVTAIQYIAVFDLAYAMTGVLPTIISLIANTWVLGAAICYLRVYLTYFIYLSGMSLIAVLTTDKWLILKWPLSTKWTKKMAHQVCCLVVVPPLVPPLLALVLDKDDVMFDFRTYTCSYGFNADIWVKLLPIISTIHLFIPNIIIVATTVPTLRYISVQPGGLQGGSGGVFLTKEILLWP